MRKKRDKSDKQAIQFFVLLGVVIIALVVLTQDVSEGTEVSEEEGYIEIDVQTSLEEAENLVGEAWGTWGSPACKDSDNGKKYYVIGYVTGYRWIKGKYKAYRYYDKCMTWGTHKGELKEWYCKDGKPVNVYKKCPNGCQMTWNAKHQTRIGACKPAPQEECTCTDSDSLNYYTLGTTTRECPGDTTSSVTLKKDLCRDANTLEEFYCKGDVIMSQTHVCVHGCQDGSCIKELQIECTDSDGGLKYNVQGTCSDSHASGRDYCEEDGGVIEYYCHPVLNKCVGTSSYRCPNGYICEHGACIVEPE